MGKKNRFIDKKRSATFQLLARDTADSSDPKASDFVFVRVDNNPYTAPGFFDDDEENHENKDPIPDDSSIFADAPDDDGPDGGSRQVESLVQNRLADDVRKQILELGLPDDGYNYLLHLREIKFSGGGSSYYQNPKPRMDLVPLDVKAYDASKVNLINGAGDEGSLMYAVASKTVGVKVQKAVDADVAKLLDDGELSMFGSDVEDLEEDFVIKANLLDEWEKNEESFVEKRKGVVELSGDFGIKGMVTGEKEDFVGNVRCVEGWLEDVERELHNNDNESAVATRNHEMGRGDDFRAEKRRPQRLLDEQFDLLALREYDNESNDDGAIYEDNEAESLAAKLNDALKDYHVDELDLEDKYRVPADFKHLESESGKSAVVSPSAEIIRKCAEYAEKYNQEEDHDDDKVVIFEESSDEFEIWDCETIVTTYSTLDNHPGKIQAPQKFHKKVPLLLPVASGEKSNVITLKGIEKFPIDFLPKNKRTPTAKVKKLPGSAPEQQHKKRSQEESKEEKKERKAAVKEEKREARRAKKELKGLYKCEAQKAQKVAAFSGPSSIHLM